MSPVYQLKITLQEVEPAVWRRLQVDGSITLDRLHTVIQKALGWTDSHVHEFEIRGRRYGTPVPDEPEYKVDKEWLISLREAAPVDGTTFSYVYDLGDHWTHEILVERIEMPEKPSRYPVCLGGERACPPEDCGGSPGYEALLEALSDPKHPEHREMFRWVGHGFDAEEFDLAAVNRKLRLLK